MRTCYAFLTVGMLLLSAVVSAAWGDAPFVITTVDGREAAGGSVKVAVDGDGSAVVIYTHQGSYALNAASLAGNNYLIETIDNAYPGGALGLAVNPYGEIYASWFKGGELWVGEKKDSWSTRRIEQNSPGLSGAIYTMSLISDKYGLPHLAFGEGQTFRYSSFVPQLNDWMTEVWPSQVMRVTVSLNDERQPVIGYANTHNEIIVQYRVGTGWVKLPAVEGERFGMDTDGQGTIHLFNEDNGAIYHRVFYPGGGWTSPAIIIETTGASINSTIKAVCDSDNHFHLAYVRGNHLVYASSRGLWTQLAITELNTSPYVFDMAVDGQGQPMIAYREDGTGWVKLAAFELARPDRADYNVDGIVNLLDYSTFYGSRHGVEDFELADLNDNGQHDIGDLGCLGELWLWQRNYVDVRP